MPSNSDGFNMRRLTRKLALSYVAALRDEISLPRGYDLDLATLDDLEALVTLGKASFDYNTPKKSEFRYFLTKAHAIICVFRQQKTREIIGFVLFEINCGNKSMYVNMSAIHPDHQGRGLGHTFYRITEGIARKHGCYTIRRNTAIDNHVNTHIAKAHDFIVVQKTKNYYDNGKTGLMLRKRLRKSGWRST